MERDGIHVNYFGGYYHWNNTMVIALDIPSSNFKDSIIFEKGNDREKIREQIKTLVGAQLAFVGHPNT